MFKELIESNNNIKSYLMDDKLRQDCILEFDIPNSNIKATVNIETNMAQITMNVFYDHRLICTISLTHYQSTREYFSYSLAMYHSGHRVIISKNEPENSVVIPLNLVMIIGASKEQTPEDEFIFNLKLNTKYISANFDDSLVLEAYRDYLYCIELLNEIIPQEFKLNV